MRPIHILTVDDDCDILGMLVQYFTLCRQWRASPARTSEDALELLEHQRFDLITTDINHPGMNGLEFTQIVRHRNGPPVIVMSGYIQPNSRQQTFASGARAFLCKPFKLDRLAEIIELVVGKGVHYIGWG